MGNALKKPMAMARAKATKRDIEALQEDDKSLKTLTILSDCQLCHFPITPKLKLSINNNCPDHTLCKKCMVKHINSKLEMEAIEITCPGSPDCKVVLDPVSVRDIIGNHRPYKQWLERLCYAAIAGQKKCYCPNCRTLIIEECCGPRSYPTKTKCPKCRQWLCFLCRTRWHEGEECNLSIPREMISLSEMLFMAKAVGEKKKFSRCPKCRFYAELIRERGLCIITCRCKTAYCFHCEGEVTKLSCTCEGFKDDIKDYNGCIMFKMLMFIIPFGIVLMKWAAVTIESEAYFE